MDYTVTLIVIAFIVFSLFSTLLALRFLTKRRIKETEEAKGLAALLGLRLLEPAEAMRRAYEVSGQTDFLARLEKLPQPVVDFLRDNASWIVEGERSGVPVDIYSETRGSGRSSTTYTVVRANLASPLAFDLHVAKEGAVVRLGKALFNVQDIEIGDEDIDPYVRIKSADPEAARVLLGKSEVKRALIAALSQAPGFHVTSTFVDWDRVGTTADPAVITPILDALVPLAKALGSAKA